MKTLFMDEHYPFFRAATGEQGGAVGGILMFGNVDRDPEQRFPDGPPGGIGRAAADAVNPQRVGRAEFLEQAVAAPLDGGHAFQQALEKYRIIRRSRFESRRQARIVLRKALAGRGQRIVVETGGFAGLHARREPFRSPWA